MKHFSKSILAGLLVLASTSTWAQGPNQGMQLNNQQVYSVPGDILANPMPTGGWLSGIYQKLSGTLTATDKPSTRTIVALDASTVTAGGTAVTALATGHRTAGGWISNPSTATVPLCISEIGAASGTTSQGNTTCITPGQIEQLTPSANAVSVVSSDSAHPFSGYGFQ